VFSLKWVSLLPSQEKHQFRWPAHLALRDLTTITTTTTTRTHPSPHLFISGIVWTWRSG
jgi:hypothetical protein